MRRALAYSADMVANTERLRRAATAYTVRFLIIPGRLGALSPEWSSSMHVVETDIGCVRQPLKSMLSVEALLVLAGLVIAYYQMHASWILFAVLLLAPDLAMLGYLRGTRIGAWSYNAFHSYVGPIVAAGVSVSAHWLLPIAVIWAAHIAIDRALGYGLKYGDSFEHTHLGIIGRRRGTPRS
jgi:hypothetical protein